MGRIRKDLVAMKVARVGNGHAAYGHARLSQIFLCPFCGSDESRGASSHRTVDPTVYESRRRCTKPGCGLVWLQRVRLVEHGPAQVIGHIAEDRGHFEEDYDGEDA